MCVGGRLGQRLYGEMPCLLLVLAWLGSAKSAAAGLQLDQSGS